MPLREETETSGKQIRSNPPPNATVSTDGLLSIRWDKSNSTVFKAHDNYLGKVAG